MKFSSALLLATSAALTAAAPQSYATTVLSTSQVTATHTVTTDCGSGFSMVGAAPWTPEGASSTASSALTVVTQISDGQIQAPYTTTASAPSAPGPAPSQPMVASVTTSVLSASTPIYVNVTTPCASSASATSVGAVSTLSSGGYTSLSSYANATVVSAASSSSAAVTSVLSSTVANALPSPTGSSASPAAPVSTGAAAKTGVSVLALGSFLAFALL
ncbi:hypothetical protein H2203_008935 [Taxawa tesnikishii (nom. ined.)]|nr:hypothetical protein H2203_008935 [Dothideales sp. JES 119]